MANDARTCASLVCLILGSISLFYACGRPPGREAPGIVPPNLISPKEQQLQAERKKIDSLNEQIAQSLNQEREAGAKLDSIQTELADAEQSLNSLQESQEAEINAKSQQYASQDLQAEREDLERQVVREELEQKIQKQQQTINQLSSQIQHEQALGYQPYDSPGIDTYSATLQEEQRNLANLQAQALRLREEAGAAGALRSEKKRWSESADQQQLLQAFEQQRQQLTQKIQTLSTQSDQLQEQTQKQRSQVADLQEQLRTERNNYDTLAAQP